MISPALMAAVAVSTASWMSAPSSKAAALSSLPVVGSSKAPTQATVTSAAELTDATPCRNPLKNRTTGGISMPPTKPILLAVVVFPAMIPAR